MHTHSIEPWQHAHVFLGQRHDRHERRTWFVVALTAAMMVADCADRGGRHPIRAATSRGSISHR